MQAARSEEPRDPDAAFEAMEILWSAFLSTREPEEAKSVLAAVAVDLAEHDGVLDLRDGLQGNRAKLRARAWVRGKLPGWLAAYGAEPFMQRRPARRRRAT